jgi:hypothetical protein
VTDQTGPAPLDDPRQPALLARLASADVVISSVLLAVFVGAYLGARDWPFATRLFPTMVSIAGIAFALLKIGMALLRPAAAPAAAITSPAADADAPDEEDDDEALEYVFARASRRDWARALGWVTGFFVALLLIGALATIPAFTVIYLLREARTTVRVAVVYAAVLGGVLFAAVRTLNMALPPGVLLG